MCIENNLGEKILWKKVPSTPGPQPPKTNTITSKWIHFFPLNPGCLIGLLIMVCYNSPHNWVGNLIPNKSPKQPTSFSLNTLQKRCHGLSGQKLWFPAIRFQLRQWQPRIWCTITKASRSIQALRTTIWRKVAVFKVTPRAWPGRVGWCLKKGKYRLTTIVYTKGKLLVLGTLTMNFVSLHRSMHETSTL